MLHSEMYTLDNENNETHEDLLNLSNEDLTKRGTQRVTPEERARINAQNATHSTGPRTEAGKARSSMNALRPNRGCPILYFVPEELEAFQDHQRQYVVSFRPVTGEEKLLVDKLTQLEWNIKLSLARENNGPIFAALNHLRAAETTFDPLAVDLAPEPVDLEKLGRHRARLERDAQRLRAELRLIRKERKSEDLFDEATATRELDNVDVHYHPTPDLKQRVQAALTPTDEEPPIEPEQPLSKDYGWDWEAPMFQGFAHDWAGWTNPERTWFRTFPMGRIRPDGKERWPYNPDGSPREFYDDNNQIVKGPRPESNMPESIPPPPDWGKPRAPRVSHYCGRCLEKIENEASGKPGKPRR